MTRTRTHIAVAVAALAAATAAVLGLASAPAHAGLGIACPNPLSRPFLPCGDTAHYALAPNGDFETGWAGWTLSGGARVVDGNEPFYVTNSGDDSSLSLPAGSSATSAPMCISVLSGKMRFFVGGAEGSTVRVQ